MTFIEESSGLPSFISNNSSETTTVIKSKKKKGTSILAWIAAGVLLGISGLLITGSLAHLWSTNTILTGSMEPLINPGDVIVSMPENISQMSVGQILVFKPPGHTDAVAHRIVEIQPLKDGGVAVKTKGDANNVVDPWRAEITGSQTWTVHFVIPKVGFALVWTKLAWVKILSLTIVVVLVLSIGLEKIWKKTHHDEVSL